MRVFKLNIPPYEYWPFWLFYAPVVPLWLWYALRSKSSTYFCKVNPGIEFGGFLDYSKHQILAQVPQEFEPNTLFISHKDECHEKPNFPFVVKPDVGERGVNVEVIRSFQDWKNYPIKENLILQNYIDWPLEFGVFYVRKPNEEKGSILSITGKEFLVFEGNGQQTLKEFVVENPRARQRENYLKEKFKNQWETVLSKGKQLFLEPIGNHNRGTRFYDASDLKTTELIEKIDAIAQQINGFYYGRFDVKAVSIEEFQQGKFMVLEVNGANSEPTHIYDENFNLWQAYREVGRHLKHQFDIAKFHPKTHRASLFYQAIFRRLIRN